MLECSLGRSISEDILKDLSLQYSRRKAIRSVGTPPGTILDYRCLHKDDLHLTKALRLSLLNPSGLCAGFAS